MSKTKEQFVLTEENYYSPERPHISTSMIKDYMADPAYYKRKWVQRDETLAFKVTDPMKRGLVVDHLLTNPGKPMPYVKAVKKKDDAKMFAFQKDLDPRYLVPERYWDEAMQVATDLKTHPVWSDDIDAAVFQMVLETEIEGVKICGLADRVDVLTGGKLRLIDLKVVNPIKIDSGRKWLWNCIEMKYTHQLALYQHMLAEQTGKDKKDIECAHVVAAYVRPGMTKVAAYTFTQEGLDEAFNELVVAIKQIKSKNFKPVLVEWEQAEVLGPKNFNDEDYGKEDVQQDQESDHSDD